MTHQPPRPLQYGREPRRRWRAVVIVVAVLGFIAAAELRERVSNYRESRGHTGKRCSVVIRAIDATTGRDIPPIVWITSSPKYPWGPVATNAAGPMRMTVDWTDAKDFPVQVTSDGYDQAKLILSSKSPPTVTVTLSRQAVPARSAQ